jgi:hypothetical protein
MRFLKLSVMAILAVGLIGCSSNSSVSKEKDQDMRKNMTREFTPDEIRKMGGNPDQPGPQPPATPPNKKKLGG